MIERAPIRVLFLSGSLALSLACSKPTKSEKAETPAATMEEKGPSGEGDLEAAMAAKGPKTVTAVGANGKTEVMEVGNTTLAETDTYLVKADVPGEVAAGGDGVVTINLTPKTGWKINQEFPTKLAIKAPEGVKIGKESQAAGDAAKFSEKVAVFKVDFHADSAGAKEFAGDFRFAVCTDTTCDPKKTTLAWSLNVK